MKVLPFHTPEELARIEMFRLATPWAPLWGQFSLFILSEHPVGSVN